MSYVSKIEACLEVTRGGLEVALVTGATFGGRRYVVYLIVCASGIEKCCTESDRSI